jgi:peptidoglycan/xylan/chitin deacetylase (PgdA/CDA1 family)
LTIRSRPDERVSVSEERSELDRLLAPLAPVPVVECLDQDSESSSGTITCHIGSGDPVWVRDGDWRIFARPSTDDSRMPGSDLARFTLSNGAVVRATLDEGERSVSFPFSLGEAYDNYVSEAWRPAIRTSHISPRTLDAFYRVKPFVPRRLQLAARRALVRRQRKAEFPAWPFDESVIRLLGLYVYSALLVSGRSELPFRWFWPHGRDAALTLGHDVETRDGLRLAIELADLEQDIGFRSSFNLGSWYEIDKGIVRELTERGFEIGLHGVRHDRALFGSRAEFDRQRPMLARNAALLHAEGFRSPATHRVFDWLAELPVAYDASMSHSDPFEPQPGGSCSLWPFFIGPVVELPYTLPQDHTLFNLLKARSIDLWLEQADRIERHHGLIHCVSHPDRGYLGDKEKRALYAEFLRTMADRPGLWRALPRDVARWWRLRDQPTAEQASIARGVARGGETPRDVVFECVPSATTDADLTHDLSMSLERLRVAPHDEQTARMGP